MPVCRLCLLLVHVVLIIPLNGIVAEEVQHKGRRWSSGGDGPYRLVVSADDTELHPEETVGYALVLQEKKLGKMKAGEEIGTGKSMDKYDKATERLTMKENRKRLHAVSPEFTNVRKRRRNSVASSTTGLPQTMSYNLYNHFRPLEQDVPQDHILPFLDFGRKLSTGSTPSGYNFIEGLSSTPRMTSSTGRSNEDVFHDEMDMSVVSKAIERNFPPRSPGITRKSNITEFFTLPNNERTRGSFINFHKTDNKMFLHDLQPNESGRKIQIVLSPNYGLRLNKTEKVQSQNESTITPTTTANITSDSLANNQTRSPIEIEVPVTEKNVKIEKATNVGDSEEAASRSIQVSQPVQVENNPVQIKDPLEPSPTAKILSTAVVTSVSVKESPRFPRIRANFSEVHHRINPMKTDHSPVHNVSEPLPHDNRTTILQKLAKRKFTTYRPKTTTLRTVTFRSAFRRANSSHAVVHVVSTPPTYIEVPRISPVSRMRTTYQPLQMSSYLPRKSFASTLLNSSSTSSTTELPIVASTTERTTVGSVSSSTIPTETPAPTSEASTPVTAQSTRIPATLVQKVQSSTSLPTTTEAPDFNTVLPTDPPASDLIEFRPLGDHFPHSSTQSSPTSTFKPVNSSSTTLRPYNFTVPLIPDLLWVYGQRGNHSAVKTQPSTVSVAFHETTWGIATYVLVALGMVPLLLGAVVLVKRILLHSKKKVLDESEYSSEYNRSPLPTKLPRLPAHISWEETKPTPPPPPPQPTLPSSDATKWEFPRDKLRLQTVLGQGNFGQVWKAEADDISGHEGLTRLVAAKTVKEGSTLREKEDLLRELAIMQELGAHPNVVTLLGCCTEKEPYFLIMEYVMYGKLLAFLREHRTRAHYFNFSDLSSALNSRDLTVFSYCVARGMEYLVSKGIIHRDLAARNILVDHNKLCKIADFGMSRNVRDTGEIYEQRPNRGALPIRWMAPESLHYNLFTHKSDVWSFGVLLWEIVTLGSTPYSTMGAREVMRQVVDGYRLEKPKHCKAEFFKVLAKCWHSDPKKRPSFSELKAEIGALLGNSESEGRFVDLEAMAEEIIDQGH